MTTSNGRHSEPSKRPEKPKRRPGGKPGSGAGRPGPISLRRLEGELYELIHPACVEETELDYQEGVELWRAGEPEAARDALRYALEGCRENLWVHAALGDLALREYRDPKLARGHYGYVVELVQRALPPGFTGRLPRDRDVNRPFFDALEGLIASLEAMKRGRDADELRGMLKRLG